MCNTCGCKGAENFEAKPYGDFHKRDFYTVAHGKTEEPRFAEVHETFETWDEAYKEANRLSRFTDGEYVFVISPRGHSIEVIEPQNKDYFGAYDDSISERQEWLIGELGGKVDKSMNRSKASDYIKELQGKESGTWKDAEGFEAEDWELRRDVLSAMDALAILMNRLAEMEGIDMNVGYDRVKGIETTVDGEISMTPENIKQIMFALRNQYLGEYGSHNLRHPIFYKQYLEAEGESKRKGSHAPNIELITYEDVLREKKKNQNMKDAETFEATGISDFTVMFMLGYLDQATFVDAVRYNDISASELKRYVNKLNNAFGGYEGLLQYFNLYDTEGEDVANFFATQMKETYKRGGNTYNQYYDFDDDYTKEQFMEDYRTSKMSAEGFEANEEAVEQTDANMVNEGSVEAFYGGGAKVSVSSAGIQPTANPSVDEAFDVGNQVGLDVAEQEIMNENPSVEVNYGAENDDDDDDDDLTDCQVCGEMFVSGALNQHPTTLYDACYECFENEIEEDDEGWVDVEDFTWDRDEYDSENMSLRESAKLGFGVGAGLLGFNVALLGIATIGGFLLNRD